jgi:hypothetical protein
MAEVDYPPEDLLKQRPARLSTAEWESFKQNLAVSPLAVEYTVR